MHPIGGIPQVRFDAAAPARARDARVERVELHGLPPGLLVRARSPATPYRLYEACARHDGCASLAVPFGEPLTLSLRHPVTDMPLRLELARAGRLGAVLAPVTSGTRPRPLAMSRTEPTGDRPGVTVLRLPPDLVRPSSCATAPAVEPGRFRTPPASVQRGRVVQPPLATDLDPMRAVIVVGDGLADEPHYGAVLKQPPGTTWPAALEHAWASDPHAANGGYVVSVTTADGAAVPGVGSDWIRPGVYARTAAALDAVRRPRALVLAVGVDDVRRGTPAAKVERELRRTIDLARSVSPATQVVLAGFDFPADVGPFEGRSQRTADYRAMYATVACEAAATAARAGRAERFVFVPDLLGPLLDRDRRLDRVFRIGKDPIHPNAAGQAHLRSVVERALSGPRGSPS